MAKNGHGQVNIFWHVLHAVYCLLCLLGPKILVTPLKSNPEYEKTRVVMADKDIGERDVIKEALPKASVLICLFHALRIFRREISSDKLGITAGQRNLY